MFRACHLAFSLAFLAFFVAGCVGDPPMAPRKPTPGVPHFRIVTYNIHRDRANDAPTVAAVGDTQADIVCLQEVTSEWARVLRGVYAQRYPHMLFQTKENAGGLAVLSRFPLADRGIIPVRDDWHPGWLVDAETNGGRVQILSVHLRSLFNGDSNPLSNYLSTSEDHVGEIDLFMTKWDDDVPTIVAGDFNESPDGAAVKVLERRGFRNALPLFRPGQFTWQGRSVASVLEMTIDHVMFDESFAPLDAKVARRGNSDHLPVIADLEFVQN